MQKSDLLISEAKKQNIALQVAVDLQTSSTVHPHLHPVT